ncbi:MAG: molybdopterin-dependent oxidoreductase [Coriobacteriales bacterium]|jgi:trimethylamine-N-oxide reductase (cytochrome c)|nr:molybdopterin-dependent oxidoreductase [Coriobacteriales bacterium]
MSHIGAQDKVPGTALDVNGQRFTTCSTAGPLRVHVKDERILRVEPLSFEEEDVVAWHLDVNGKVYRPPLTAPVLPWGITSKKMAYSDNRVLYPYKRVDWDPNGGRNAQNRGVSGYERISWDAAMGIIEAEYNRILDEYGPSALAYSHSAHPEWGSLHYLFSDEFRFRDMIGGTYLEFTPNSWEGWASGGPFLWGFWMGHGLPPAPDTVQDISEESELIILWGNDPLLHNVYNGIDTARLWQYWKDLGKEVVLIDPLLNETGLAAADVWLPIVPGTDNAMAAAIAWVWITEDTYDKRYIREKTVGFDEGNMPDGGYNEQYLQAHPAWDGNLPADVDAGRSFKAYILGTGWDGVAKTPEWAAEICGIPARRIYALARAWATRPTSFWVMEGGACRRTFGHEFARMMGTLAMMQGLGKPGSNIIGTGLSLSGPYDGMRQLGPTGYADGGMNVVLDRYFPNPIPAKITFTKFMDCMYDAPQSWRGGHIDNFGPEMFFDEVHYPMAGCSEIKLLWQRGSTLTNPPELKRQKKGLQAPGLDTVIVAAPWFDRDCHYADLVLPITTIFERQDITEPGSVGQYVPPSYSSLRSAVYNQKAIEPLGESKTDLDIFADLAERLGRGEDYMEGNTEETLLQKMFARTNIPMSYDDFKEKGYFVWPHLADYRPNKQFADYYNLPLGTPVPGPLGANVVETPTGKVEIYSTLIHAFYGPDNPEIPCVPHYIPEVEGAYDAKREQYPLQMLMAHPKFRFHGKYDKIDWLAENYKVAGPDGYRYEPVTLNPADARARGLAGGEVVRCFNDRGEVLAGVVVSDRIACGVAWLSYGAWNDPVGPENESLDRSGDGNVLSYPYPQSVHHVGGAFNSVLFEVEKVDLDALAARHPEGFAGRYSSFNRTAKTGERGDCIDTAYAPNAAKEACK